MRTRSRIVVRTTRLTGDRKPLCQGASDSPTALPISATHEINGPQCGDSDRDGLAPCYVRHEDLPEHQGEYRQVRYRPIEAAIRWSELFRHEPEILRTLRKAGKARPDRDDQFPGARELRTNFDRLYDGIVNRELPVAFDDRVIDTPSNVDLYIECQDPHLTIRHVDLRRWMTRYYPAEKPRFLFSRLERTAHPAMTIETVLALGVECDGLKLLLKQREKEIQRLRHEKGTKVTAVMTPRGETTYLHIIGSLLLLLLGCNASGQPNSCWRKEESLIFEMVKDHGHLMGIAKRTLEGKFAKAKQLIRD